MEVHFHTTRKHAFVVRQDGLQKIWKLLEDHIGAVNASAECSDDMVREFNNWEQLASYENPSTKKMLKLSIQSRSDDRNKSANVNFSDNSWGTIRIWIEAPKRVGAEVKDAISDILDGMKPWYSVLARVDIPYVIIFVFGFAYIVSNIYFLNQPTGTPKGISFERAFFLSGAVILFLGILAFFIWALNKIWSWLFPVGFFALGQGEQRYKTVEKVQWGILITFLVSLVASTVGLLW